MDSKRKLELVIRSLGAKPEVSLTIITMLIQDLVASGIKNFDNSILLALAEASPAIQYSFMLGGLTMLCKSQKAIIDGWTPSSEEIAKLEKMGLTDDLLILSKPTAEEKVEDSKEEPPSATFFN